MIIKSNGNCFSQSTSHFDFIRSKSTSNKSSSKTFFRKCVSKYFDNFLSNQISANLGPKLFIWSRNQNITLVCTKCSCRCRRKTGSDWFESSCIFINEHVLWISAVPFFSPRYMKVYCTLFNQKYISSMKIQIYVDLHIASSCPSHGSQKCEDILMA